MIGYDQVCVRTVRPPAPTLVEVFAPLSVSTTCWLNPPALTVSTLRNAACWLTVVTTRPAEVFT